MAQPGLSVGSDVVVGEGDGYVDLPIQLNAPGTLPVTVSYAARMAPLVAVAVIATTSSTR